MRIVPLHAQRAQSSRNPDTAPLEGRGQVVPLHPEPVLVAPGAYQAIYVGHRALDIFRAHRLVVWLRLMEHLELFLPRYYRVTNSRPRVSAPASSDIAREIATALSRRVRPDRIPVGDLAGIVLRVEVRTVQHDRQQRELSEVCTYSVVDRIVGPA